MVDQDIAALPESTFLFFSSILSIPNSILSIPKVQERKAHEALQTQQEILQSVQSAKSSLMEEQNRKQMELLELETRAQHEKLRTSDRLLQNATSELGELKSSLHSKDVMIERLKDEKARLDIEHDRLSRLNGRMSDEVQSNSARAQAMESQLLKLQDEFQLEATKAANLKQLLGVSVGKERNARKLVAEVSQIIDDQKNQIRQWKRKSIQQMENEQRNQHTIHNLRATYMKDLSTLEEKRTQKERDYCSVVNDKQQMQETLTSKLQELQIVQMQLAELTETHRSVQNAVSERDSVILIKDKILEDKCQEIKGVKDRWARESSALSAKLSDYEQEIRLLQTHKDHDELDHDRVYDLEERNRELEDRSRDLDSAVAALQEENHALRKEFEDKDQEVQALRFVEGELQRLRLSFQQSEEKAKCDFDEKIRAIQDAATKQQHEDHAQIANLASRLQATIEEKALLDARLPSQQEELRDCKTELQTAQKRCDETQKKMEHYKHIAEKAAAKVIATEKDMRQLLLYREKEKAKTADSLNKMLQQVQQS